MFIDTSVFVAIFASEPEASQLLKAIRQVKSPITSPIVRLETSLVLAPRKGKTPTQVTAIFDELIQDAAIAIHPLTDEIGRASVIAAERYGKGRGHPAQLNLADCLSYAFAKALEVPILFKGNDFNQTDLEYVNY